MNTAPSAARPPQPSASKDAVLALRGISKSYLGTRALSGVDLDIHAGEVVGLLGQNGAGKSTLVKIVSGAESPSSGQIFLDGSPVQFHSPHAAQAAGVFTIYQELSLIPELSAAENIYLSDLPRRGGAVNWAALRRAARSTLMGLGFDVDADRPVRSLPVGTQQAIEIAKAVHRQSKLVLFDEPTATLPMPDVVRLFKLIRQLRDSGVGILYISHRLDEIYDICDRIVVLRDGQQIATHPVSEVTADDAVKLMLGDRLTGSLVGQQGHGRHRRINPNPPPEGAAVALDIRQLSGKVLRSVSLTVMAGEAVAVTGLVGSGQSELGACLFGHRRFSSGQIRTFGRETSVKSPRAAIRAGLAWVPEERKSQGLVLGMSVSANLAMANIAKAGRHGLLFSRAERRQAEQSVSALGIKTSSVGQKVRELSGGNQQKVVMGKWLLADSKIMVASEPTRGIDVAAKEDIYREIREFLGRGGSVLILTAELDEALLCDRIYVLGQGCIVGEFEHNQIDLDRLVSMLR